MVCRGVATLGLIRAQKFQQTLRCLGVAAGTGDTTASDVHVHGVGPAHGHLARQGLVGFPFVAGLHSAQVVAVGQGDTALPLGDSSDHRRVAAEDRFRQVVHHAFDPVLSSGRPLFIQHEGHQGLVVDTAAVAQAELAFEAGVGQRPIAAHLLCVDAVSVEHRGPQATGQAEPASLAVTQIAGHRLVEGIRVDRLEQIHAGGPVEPGHIRQDQHIGGGVISLGVEPFDQSVVLRFQQLHLNAGGLGEARIEVLVGVVVTA